MSGLRSALRKATRRASLKEHLDRRLAEFLVYLDRELGPGINNFRVILHFLQKQPNARVDRCREAHSSEPRPSRTRS